MRYNDAMESKKLRIIILIVAVMLLIGGIIVVVRYLRAPEGPREQIVARAQYAKGNASFLYPAVWRQNDIPTSPGFISVQLYDPENGVVFVASSNEKESDPLVDGTVTRDAGIVVGGISGKERAWENEKTQAVVLRADHISFAGRAYRFEMFGQLSRKVLMEKYWRDIVSSVQFAEAHEEGIIAAPATSSASTEEQR